MATIKSKTLLNKTKALFDDNSCGFQSLLDFLEQKDLLAEWEDYIDEDFRNCGLPKWSDENNCYCEWSQKDLDDAHADDQMDYLNDLESEKL